MTTPKEASIQAMLVDDMRWSATEMEKTMATMLRDLANQVERLEAQRKELREALHELCDYADTSNASQYGTLSTSFVRNIALDALKATQ